MAGSQQGMRDRRSRLVNQPFRVFDKLPSAFQTQICHWGHLRWDQGSEVSYTFSIFRSLYLSFSQESNSPGKRWRSTFLSRWNAQSFCIHHAGLCCLHPAVTALQRFAPQECKRRDLRMMWCSLALRNVGLAVSVSVRTGGLHFFAVDY